MQGGRGVCVSLVLLAAFLLSGANAQISCSGTEVRLLNGFNSSEGQVGICSNGVFRQVCSTGFDVNDARVICSELGYSEMNPKVFTSNSPYGQGVNSGYAFSNFGCGGTETSLNSCSKTNISSCFQVVGVDCFPCNAGDVRLENETTPGTGRVQFCSSSGVWSSVCDDNWSTSDAKVLCKQLGYSQLTAQAFGSGTHGDAYFPGIVGSFICNETESTISDCSYNTSASCSASDVASVQCTAKGLCESAGHTTCCTGACGIFSVSPTCYCDTLCLVFNDCCDDFDLTCQSSPGTQCTNGDLRLSQNFTGRVEFCVGGTYGTVCEKGWDNIEAKVVCTQLGYGTSGVAVPGGNFPQVAVPFVATNFGCTGSESMLSSCTYDTAPGLLDCGHQQDAAVKCPEPCTGNSLRLAGGTSVYNGRLEVCLNGYYGTVCQGDWSVEDATVVCRQLGYSPFGVQAYGNAYYGQGVGPIHYTNVSCDGTETMLSSCGLGLNPSCDHSMDVGVYCDGVPTLCEANGHSGCCTGSCGFNVPGSTATCYCDSSCHTYNDCCPGIDKTCPSSPVPANCTTGSIRLVEGQNIRQGRLEVCLNGQWTSVCDNGWDNSDAQVVCGQLGFGAAGGTAVSGGLFGQSSFPVGSEGYQCTGTESSLTSCPYSTSSTCSHHQDAGVICLDTCSPEGAVRLVGGTGNSSGFVQICRNNKWGYICDYNWCSNDADVLCTQLGYSPNRAEAYGASYFGQALGQIHYTNFQCGGSETSLDSCTKTTASTDDCTFTELAGVQCFEQGQCESAGHTDCCTSSCNAGGCFCDSACYTFGDCCDNIGNTCPLSCTSGDTRLVGGDDDNGRLEICTDGKWGTVCSGQFDYNDAIVICRQLNKALSGANVETDLSFGQGILPIRISNFGCAGNESNFQSCSYDTSGFCCGHHQVVGVRCPPQCTVGDIRLVNGTNQYEGRLEVCVNGDWATVCDNTFSTADATVACKQLGFSAVNAQAFGQAYFGQGTGPIGVASTMCTGDEIAAVNCSFSLDTSGCTHANDAGVRCSGEVGPCESIGHTTCCTGGGCSPPGISCYCDSICHVFGDCCTDAIDKTCPQATCTTGDVRLNNNGTFNNFFGLVEVCIGGQLGVICDDDWDEREALVVCKELGYANDAHHIAVTGAAYGQSSLNILATSFQCTGGETNLTLCNYSTSPDCGHHMDAAVICNVPCQNGDVRLINGTANYEGRVEICQNGTWGWVCDQGWNINNAKTVCRDSGFSVLLPQAFGLSHYGSGDLSPYLSSAVCTGDETHFANCTLNPGTCSPDNAAGVACSGTVGQCEGAGHTTCCVSGCGVSSGGTTCFCDSLCHTFNDCCDDISSTCPDSTCTDGDVRLADGSNQYNGRVEVCLNGVFGTVCDEGWDNNDARVICRQLGSSIAGTGVSGASFGQGTIPPVVTNFGCTGAEAGWLDCTYSADATCSHHMDASAICPEPCNVTGDVRLVNGSDDREGRVEVCSNGYWNSICDEGWCDENAGVICSQLGFSSSSPSPYGGAYFGISGGPVYASGLTCPQGSTHILNCTVTAPTPGTCPHTQDAGVRCSVMSQCEAAGHTGCCTSGCFINGCWCDSVCHIFNDCCPGIENTCPLTFCTEGEVRLSDGTNSTTGRVETCIGSRWYTVCDKVFGTAEGRVTCRGLGYHADDFQIQTGLPYGQGDGPILDKGFNCDGGENSLDACPGAHICCNHVNDVGISCQPACVHGDARLVGPSENEGRVEVCSGIRWGTVCDDFWGTNDARVACKQAGLPWRGAIARGNAAYGQGVGPIFLDDLACTGTEPSLFNCTFDPTHNCNHIEDAGVLCQKGPCELAGYVDSCCPADGSDCQGKQNESICYCSYDCHIHNDCCIDADLSCSCTDGDLRLVGGSESYEGRVEICLNNVWGTVCDDLWGNQDAAVVCRQLNLQTGAPQAFSFSFFGQGTGPIQLDNVQCIGNESHLVNCTYITNHNCIHFEDAGVRCSPPVCNHGDLRLENGANDKEGRVEVCYNGVWGTVCDDFWGSPDAQVVCKQLGFETNNAVATSFSSFGFGTDPFVMDNVQCSGTESHLVNCTHITNHNCFIFEVAGVICKDPCMYDGQLSLYGGSSNTEGRVEVCMNGQWGTVCDDQFENVDAAVICKTLGLPFEGARAFSNAFFGQGTGSIVWYNLDCGVNDTHIDNCSTPSPPSPFTCFHFEDAGVQCNGPCSINGARLVGGSNSNEGRVEVCKDGYWGTICDDPSNPAWSTEDARVVCRQLGLPYAAARTDSFGRGGDPIHYSDIVCSGSESSIAQCMNDDTPSCTHFQDVGVTCQNSCPSFGVRLVDGPNTYSGRIEVCIGGQWGTICDDEWDTIDARTVCRQMGLPYDGAEARLGATFGQGTESIAMSNVYCMDNSTAISMCQFRTGSDLNCGHHEDAGVICQSACTNGDIRLVAGSTQYEGRLEVCFNKEWGTVCDDHWSTNDAKVVCRQLGFSTDNPRVYGSQVHGAGVGIIYYSNVMCTGDEPNIALCPLQAFPTDCEHNEDAGVMCSGPGSGTPPTSTPTPPMACPTAVQNLVFNITSDSTAVLTWDEPATTNGVIIDYTIAFRNGNSPTAKVVGSDPRILNLNGLSCGVPYIIDVFPTNLFCSGPNVTIPTTFICELPPAVGPTLSVDRCMDNSELSASVSWTALTPAQARGILTSYTVSYAPYDGTIPRQLTPSTPINATMSSYKITNLSPVWRYYITAQAANAKGPGPRSTAVIAPTTSVTLIQLKISLLGDQMCGSWVTSDGPAKQVDIMDAITTAITQRCNNCGFTRTYITAQRFQCNELEVNQVTFRARVYSTCTYTNDSIISDLNDWVSGAPKVVLQGSQYNVDQNCVPVSITSFDDSYCRTVEAFPVAAAAASGVSVALIIVIVLLVVLVFVILMVRRTKIKYRADDGTHEMVGFTNRMAIPEGNEDNISQRMGSTVHDDDFQEAINMISDDVEQRQGFEAKVDLDAGRR